MLILNLLVLTLGSYSGHRVVKLVTTRLSGMLLNEFWRVMHLTRLRLPWLKWRQTELLWLPNLSGSKLNPLYSLTPKVGAVPI